VNVSTRRFLLGVVLPVVLVVLGVVPWLVTWADLPDPVATHFDLGGDADGHMPPAVALVVHGAAALAIAVGLRRAERHPTASLPAEVGGLALVGTLFGVFAVVGAGANSGAARWQEVDLALGWVLVALLAGVAAAFAAARVGAGLVPAGATGPAPVPGLALGDDERAAWFGGTRSRLFTVLAVIAAVATVLLGMRAAASATTMLVLTIVFAVFSSVHVVVGAAGLQVRAAFLPWPRVHFPLDEIESATASDIRPMAWGGWGYRGSVRLFRRAAWVLRGGPALEVRLTGGRRFLVTVDDAEEAAAVLNGLRATA
jgi:hypothetical protein